mgnify:CR=1 FL=1
MNAELLDIDKFEKMNSLQEVDDPICFDRGDVPTKGGVFSNEIFGLSVAERRENYGIIHLGSRYMTPKAFNALKMLNRNFEKLIYGTKNFRIDAEGQLVEDPDGETGIDFLYENWEKLNFIKNQSVKRTERVDLLVNNKKDVIFCIKWIVIPAFYRDVNRTSGSSGKTKVPEINDKYNEIIRCVRMIHSANTFDFMINNLKGKVQGLLYEIYNIFKMKLEKKNGYFRKFLMGKSDDYCSRNVITAVSFHSNTPGEQTIDFEHTGVPLYTACTLFTPFILWWVGRYFKNQLGDVKDSFPIWKKGSDKPIYVHLKDPEIEFNSDFLAKQLDRMVENPSSRFDTIPLPVVEEDMKRYGLKSYPQMIFRGRSGTVSTSENPSGQIERPMTWTDIFYMAAHDVTQDKHVEITRYPMLDYLGTYFSKMHIISTRETIPMVINDVVYPDYPKIVLDDKGILDRYFVDALKIYPMYLPGLDGDHDGDQVTIKGLFSQEANEEAQRIIFSKINILTTDGDIIRSIGNEGIQTLFTLTRFH